MDSENIIFLIRPAVCSLPLQQVAVVVTEPESEQVEEDLSTPLTEPQVVPIEILSADEDP